jgi:hypothetical protein
VTSYEDDLEALAVEWAARADRVSGLMGTAIPATRVPAVVVDYR